MATEAKPTKAIMYRLTRALVEVRNSESFMVIFQGCENIETGFENYHVHKGQTEEHEDAFIIDNWVQPYHITSSPLL